MEEANPRDEPPASRPLASLREGRLVLTEDRILHRRRGIEDAVLRTMAIRDVSGVSLRRRAVFRPWFLVVPVAVLVIFTNLASEFPVEVDDGAPSTIHQDDIINLGFLLALMTLPLPLVIPGMVLRISVADQALRCRISKKHHEEARGFMEQLVALRIRGTGRRERTDEAMPTPTASPFGQ